MDEAMMKEALIEACLAFDKGEVPVGAILVQGTEIIARAHNEIEGRQDPSAHAELLVIRQGAKALGNWRLIGTTLYTTLEPCLMCAGALLLARVSRVVWGAPDLRHGANGSYLNIFEAKHPTHSLSIEGGCLEVESANLLKEFFKLQRCRHATISGNALR